MRNVSVKEVRQHLARLVESARRGTSVIITRRGRKVAKLSPVTERKLSCLPDLTAFRASLKSARKGCTTTIADLRREERF